MMLNRPMLDWLTLTTFEARQADGLRSLFTSTTPAKRLQYKGHEDGQYSWFIGKAKQNYDDHWMFVASGESAHIAFKPIVENWTAYDWNITRIDLQVTVPLPPRFNSRQLYDDIAAWDGPGRPRKPSLVQSGDGNDTVYIGSRTSNRFTRIYVKPLDGGLKALRFEVEYKGESAHRVFHDCRHDASLVGGTLAYEIDSLPELTNGLKNAFLRATGRTGHKVEEKRVTGENSTLDWLREQVEPALKRLLNSHEYGDAAMRIVQDWATYAADDYGG